MISDTQLDFLFNTQEPLEEAVSVQVEHDKEIFVCFKKLFPEYVKTANKKINKD